MELSHLLMICTLLVAANAGSSQAPLNSTWFARSGEVVLEVPLSGTMLARCGFVRVKGLVKGSEDLYVFAVYVISVNEDVDGKALITWQANWNTPVPGNSTLSFAVDGNLVLRFPNGSHAWESATSNQAVQKMELLSTQNLVIYTFNTTVEWQSFDHPRDFLLPSQELQSGQSLRNNQYTLKVRTHRLLLTDTSYDPPQPYGAWVGAPDTEISSMRFDNVSSLRILDKSYKTINQTSLWNPNMSSQCVRTGLLLHKSGKLAIVCDSHRYYVQLDTVRDELCRIPKCGHFGICSKGNCSCPRGQVGGKDCIFQNLDKDDHSKGCKPPSELVGTPAYFLHLQGVDLLSANYLPDLTVKGTGIRLEDCKLLCLQNSSCKAVTYRSSSFSCYMSSVVLLVETAESGVITSIRVGLSPSRAGRNHKMYLLWRKIVISVLAVSCFLVLMVLICLHKRLCKKPTIPVLEPCNEISFPNLPKRFTLPELSKITCEFQNKIGEGGYSTVYKGVLPDGCTKVAVKCLEGGPKQSQKQFEAEVMTIGSTDHKNLVKLLGYGTNNGKEYFLVYEFLANLSLDRWLFNGQGSLLSWSRRFSIALDIASGLCYLHHGCSSRVLHLDIKPQNVVLDTNFRAKICDFGLAKQVDTGLSVQTMARGTPGYMAPEWVHSKVSEKADVYSFGLLLLELVSGQKTVSVPSCMSVGSSALGLKTFVKALHAEALELVVDATLHGNFDARQLEKIVELGVSCLEEDPCQRPTMQAVVKVLEDSS